MHQGVALRFLLVLQVLGRSIAYFVEHFPNATSIALNAEYLTVLDGNIGKLVNLEELYIQWNRLPELPNEVGESKKRYLSQNKVTAFSRPAGRWGNIQELWISNNKLEKLPNGIGRCKKLKKLYLRRNRLTSLPGTMKHLYSLEELDLRGNPISTFCEGKDLDKICIKEIWGTRAKLDEDPDMVERDEIEVGEVYRNLRKQPLYWNIERLRALKTPPISDSVLGESDLMEMWNASISKLVTSDTNKKAMEQFIHHLYNPGEEYEGWPLPPRNLGLAKNLIKAIFTSLSEAAENDPKAISYISRICEVLDRSPDRKFEK